MNRSLYAATTKLASLADLLATLQDALAGRYAIQREIGRGGMAIVLLAQDLKHHRQVAIKVLRPELAASLGADRFLREIQTAARLTHPHILSLHDSGEAAGFLYYVMPYVEGETLRQRLEHERQLPLDDALAITRQVAAALSHAHSQDVVHRDIKPENILLSGGEAVVADFGIARAITEAGGDRVTETGVPIGTPAYMSPEQAGGESQVDGRSDVYSLACVLYEMLVGAPPFTGPSAQAVMARHSLDPVPPVRTVRATVPPHFEQVITKAMAKIPADRYATAADFVQALLAKPVGPPPSGIRMPARLLGSRVTLSLGAILLVLGGTWFTWRRLSGPAASLSPDVVAILPFTVRGNPELTDLSEGMVDLLASKLDGAGTLRVVDPRALLAFLKSERIDQITPELGQRAAAHFGAGRFLLGSVVEVAGRVQVTTATYDHDGGTLTTSPVEGQADDLPDLIDDVARQLAVQLSGPETRVEAVTTTSLPALRAYLEGVRVGRAGLFDSAAHAFRRAVGQDTAFALAWYSLAALPLAPGAGLGDSLAGVAIEMALRHSGGLSQHDRDELQAFAALFEGNADEAERRYRSIVRRHPDDVEAWSGLAGVLGLRFAAARGRQPGEAREAHARVIALDPEEPGAYFGLAVIAGLEHKPKEFDSLIRQVITLSPRHEWAQPVLAAGPFLASDREAQERFISQANELKDRDLIAGLWNIATFARDLVSAIRLAQLADDPTRPVPVRATARVTQGHLELARGHWRAGRAALEAAMRLDSATLEDWALLGAAPFLQPSRDELETLRRAVDRWSPKEAVPVEGLGPAFNKHAGVHQHLRIYLLGLLSANLGDDQAALRYADALEAMPSPRRAGSLAGDLALGVRAEVARLRGRSSEALAALERAEQRFGRVRPILSSVYSRARERFLRAELLVAVGRPTEAIGWYASVDASGHYDIIYAAPSHLRRGEIYERLGERERAAEHYAEFVELWKDGDPEFRPLVEEAKQRIARLTGEQKR